MPEQSTLFGESPVTLETRWHDLLGDSDADMTETQRRDRWAGWLRLAKHHDADTARYWASADGCRSDDGARCCHLKGRAWCGLMALPCTVNPVLTMRHGMIGMACMGAGFEGGDADAE